MKYTTQSEIETKALGKKIAKDLHSPITLLFYGDLGAGKTTMIQGVAEGLGIKKKVKSPTFVFRRDYQSDQGQLIHLDLYRITNPNDLESIEWEAILSEDAIRTVEWAERLEDQLPSPRIEIQIEETKDGSREIEIKARP